MARKRDFKAEYAARLARAKAAGRTRQQARGHRSGEARERARRERVKHGGLTVAEESRIRQFVDRRWNDHNAFYEGDASTFGKGFRLDADEVIAFAQTEGYEFFQKYRDAWYETRRTYIRDVRNGTYIQFNESHLDTLAGLGGGVPVQWMYYH